MPGNEVGDRVHNFFDQGSLSQDQHHTQLVAANWPVYNNNVWSANERQTGGPVNSGSENYNAQQADIVRGQGNHILLGPQGLNFPRSGLRPDFVKSPQQLNLNGFMHASQVGHTRQNEANFLGMDTELDRHNMASRGMSVIESQQRSGSQQANSAGFGGSDIPMNFGFLGGQQQMNSQQVQQPGMLQSFSRQHPGNNEAQFQQQVMLKQMQEIQRQQQQLEAMQRSATNNVNSFPNQSAGQHPPAVNGNPMLDSSNYPWSSQAMAPNANWQQRGVSLSAQGYSNGFMITPEQGQAMFSMGLIPQQTSQSLYGVPVPGSRSANAFSHGNIDKPGMAQGPGPFPNTSFPGNQYGSVSEQVSMKDGTLGSRYKSEGKSSLEQVSSQHLENVVNSGGFAPVQQRNVAISEGGGKGFAGGSEFVSEKSVTEASPQGASTQSPVGLDPTEEKILFGSDDNIWEAFGDPSLTGSVEATDVLNGLPSLQSGTWSALMQSAVAETSSTDVGMQEEWGGAGSQNSQSQSGNQQSSVIHGTEKSQLNFVDSSSRASMGSRLSSNDANTRNANTNTNFVSNSGQQPPLSKQRQEYLQAESQIAQEGRRWLDGNQQKPHVEEQRVSTDGSRTDNAFWSHQQNEFLHNSNAQQSSRPSPSNFIGYVPANGGLVPTNQDNLVDKDRNMQMSRETGRGSAMRLEPVPNSNIRMGSSLVNPKDKAVAPGSSNLKGNYESGQKLPNNQQLDLWRSVNSSGISGSEVSGREQHNLNMGPAVLETSYNSLDAGASEPHETETRDRREGSNDSHRSSFPRNTSVGGLRENMWSDAADRRSLPGAKEKSSDQVVKRGPVSRKFQYHPMGDLDMDSDTSYAAKQVLHSHALPQHLSSGIKGQEPNPTFLGQLNANTTDTEKGRASNFHGPVNVSSGGVHPVYLPSTSTPFVRSSEISSPNQHISPRQNMLELLHKVDQSKEQTTAFYPSSADYNRVSDILTAGPVAPSQSHFSTSHGFSLQLAPPSQGIVPLNHNDAAQSSKTADSPSSGYVASEKGDRRDAWLPPVSSAQYLPASHRPNQMESGNESDRVGNTDVDVLASNLKGNFSAPLSSYSKNSLQHQHLIAPGGKGISEQSAAVSPNRHAYHDQHLSYSQPQPTTSYSVSNSPDNLVPGRDVNQSGMGASLHQTPASFHAVIAGMSRKDNLSPLGSNQWTSQQQLLRAQAGINAELIRAQFQSPGTSFTQQRNDGQDDLKRVDALSSQGVVSMDESQASEGRSTMKAIGGSQEEEPSARHLSGASPSNSAVSQKDIEAFHHSVKPNNDKQNSYSLLNQMQAMKSMGTDPSHRESKRLKGQDGGLDHTAGQATEPVAGIMDSTVRDPSTSQTSVSAGDAKMLSFSPQLGNRNPPFQMPHGTVASQDMLAFGRHDPQRFATSNITSRSDHTGISPQMAPSWFEQYGAFKNGQLLSVQNAPRMPMVKNAEQQFISGKSLSNLVVHNSVQLATAVTETGQIANTCQTANAYTPSEHVSSFNALVSHVPAPISASIRPKKRKTATSDLLSWTKEIGQSFKRLQNMSSAEIDWAQSSNRLIEKVEDVTDNSEDLLPMIRPKRRLLLTTQLIQQVFQPPSAAVLSLDASSNYEVIVYSLARSVLGEACSLVSGVESHLPAESGKLLPEKDKTSERIQDQYFSKVVEDYVTRSKELEDDLLRLDKRTSLLDFRLDCQDLERFAVINRFARFHGRGQVEGAETSSSDATAAVQKPFPQRYVYAHPMPRNVPERVQCLSL